jgi:uncharacterized protein YecE (DUF72 family)
VGQQHINDSESSVDSMTVRVGTAGWSIPKPCADRFPITGSVLERYSQRFDIVEINSSFYRPHRRTTYERWAASTPETFGFSVKLPKTITHDRRLSDVADLLARFLDEAGGLGGKLKTLLAQFPPNFAFSAGLVSDFFTRLREKYLGPIACEPRHPTWFTQDAALVLNEAGIDLTAADPPPCHEAPRWDSMPSPVYFRFHGAPKIYFSDYTKGVLAKLAQRLVTLPPGTVTCIFDNTAAGLATDNALTLKRLLGPTSPNYPLRRSAPADRP